MIITTAIVGNTILFRASFLDENGVVMAPTSARVSVVQRKVTVDADMEVDGDEFIYRLNTGKFRPGNIDWAVNATDGTTTVTADGTIMLTANQA